VFWTAFLPVGVRSCRSPRQFFAQQTSKFPRFDVGQIPGSSGFRVLGPSVPSTSCRSDFSRGSAIRRFPRGRSANFPGFPNCCITTLVEFTGFFGFFQSSPNGSAVLSRVTRFFGPSFFRSFFGGNVLNDPLVSISVSVFGRWPGRPRAICHASEFFCRRIPVIPTQVRFSRMNLLKDWSLG
jgi:hypothetical protein